MSVFKGYAPQISAMKPCCERSQFRAGKVGRLFRFVSCKGLGTKCRDDAIIARTGGLMRGYRTERAILLWLPLCSALAVGEASAQPVEETIERGKALTVAGDCASCHTADPAKPFAGGKRIDTPFGGIYSPNLTPDRDTGLGAWSDDDFYRALRYGVARDGSRYYPAFPYPKFTKLIESLAHCGACHTPKNVFGAEKRGEPFGGGLVAGMFAPRLDGAERSGLKSWSVEDITEYLQSGRNGRSHAGPLMSEVVLNSTSRMSNADIRAIATYLKDLPAGAPEPAVTPPLPAQMAEGEKIYKGACIACHEADGSGAPRIYPPLPGNANLQSADPSSTLRIMLDGAQTVTTPRAPNTGSMPAYAKLSDQQIADVTTYIRNAWGNVAPAVTPAQVAKARK
jgi:mono/diheme cytochrome c family protein